MPGSELRWMLEVVQVRAFHRLQLLAPRAPSGDEQLPGWILPAATAGNVQVGLVNVEAMVRDLAGTA